MSNKSALSDLAAFVAKSPLAAEDDATRQAAVRALGSNLMPKPMHKKVNDLLATIMVLSARSRRMVQPGVNIDIDVFSPNSDRAVRLNMRQSAD